ELGHGKCAEDGECRCDPGWEGTFCDDCVRMPGCVHGSCHQPWQCICEDGWAGRFCDKDVHVCEKEEPCQNGATCSLNEAGEYNCLCPEGFHGKHCELKTGPCHKIKGSFDWGGGGGWPVRFTQSKPNSSTSGNHFHGVTGSGGDSHLLKISVTEVVTQSGTGGLSEEQLITLLVLGGMTLAVVALTAGLVLRGHWQNLRVCSHCRISTSQQHPFQQCRSDQQHPVSTQQDCKISFLHTSVPAELEKKRLNTEVI
uniref:EGF-like domain-containing protein n=1 Tax=Electrophorus electricus TaxID=8005 RepID=A0A4W4FQZ6_ELEEL